MKKLYRRMPLVISIAAVFFILSACGMQPPTFVLEIQPSSSTFSGPGEVITYSYTLRNTGSSPLSAMISDNSLGFCTQGDAGGGGTITCELSYTTTAADVAAGVINNTASALARTPSPGCMPESEAVQKTANAVVTLELAAEPVQVAGVAEVVDVVEAVAIFSDLKVEMSANPVAYTKANDIIIYTYTAHNTGTAEVQGPFTLVDNRVQQWECDDAGVSGYSLCSDCYIGCKGYYRVQPGDICSQVTNTGHVEGASVDGVVTSNEVTATVFYAGNCNAEEPDPEAPLPQNPPPPECPPWSTSGCP